MKKERHKVENADVEARFLTCESPIIGHFINGAWHEVVHFDNRMYRLICLGWMERPEFVLARARLAREAVA